MKKRAIKPASLEATTGFEPVMRVLQTLALPLGHVAIWIDNCRFLILEKIADWSFSISNQKSSILRAGNGTRTRDLLLGKEVFYQLNYARKLSY